MEAIGSVLLGMYVIIAHRQNLARIALHCRKVGWYGTPCTRDEPRTSSLLPNR